MSHSQDYLHRHKLQRVHRTKVNLTLLASLQRLSLANLSLVVFLGISFTRASSAPKPPEVFTCISHVPDFP